MENVSVITVFSLSGLEETMNYRAALFCLTLLCYCVILFVNLSLVITIISDKNLHEPMYIFLCSFCINGLYGTTGFYPKFLLDLLSTVHAISYSGCIMQAFVMNSFACADMSVFAVMAYDRYVAICRPLVYHSVMTKQKVARLVCYSWLSPLCICAINLLLTSTLNLCSSNIEAFLCGNWVIVKLACRSTNITASSIIAYVTIFFFVGHGILIIWSYMYMVRTCVRSKEDRAKFMQTCVPHLISLITFLVAILFDLMCMRFGSQNLPQSFRNFIAIEFLLIPPTMNPLIYGFKLTKVRKRILGLFYVKIK